jgi:hypothetical protein
VTPRPRPMPASAMSVSQLCAADPGLLPAIVIGATSGCRSAAVTTSSQCGHGPPGPSGRHDVGDRCQERRVACWRPWHAARRRSETRPLTARYLGSGSNSVQVLKFGATDGRAGYGALLSHLLHSCTQRSHMRVRALRPISFLTSWPTSTRSRSSSRDSGPCSVAPISPMRVG